MTTLRDVLLLVVMSSLYLVGTATDPRPEEDAVRGQASWYDDGPGFYGAVHSYRWGDPRYVVRVCRADDHRVCVDVTVRDHMANPVRAIDLSPAAFHALWPGLTRYEALRLRGVVQVVVGGNQPAPRVTLPPTDTAACRDRLEDAGGTWPLARLARIALEARDE